MKNRSVVLLSLLFLLLYSSVAFGQMMGPGGGAGYHGMWNNYQTTPEQQKAFQEITDKYQPSFTKFADTMWSKRAQLNGILAQEKIDRKQAKALAKEVGALLAQCYELQVEMLADMREMGLSYYGMGMMHGGMMGGGMMDMMGGGMMGGMMNMMMGGGQYYQGGQRSPGNGQPGYGNRGMMQ